MSDFEDHDTASRRPVEELRRIARYQRWIVATVLAQVGLWGGYLLLRLVSHDAGERSLDFPIFITFALGCVGGIYSFLICWTVRNPFSALLMGCASVPPALGILVLTVVNGTATRALTSNGVEVGFFGADAENIGESQGYYDEDEELGW